MPRTLTYSDLKIKLKEDESTRTLMAKLIDELVPLFQAESSSVTKLVILRWMDEFLDHPMNPGMKWCNFSTTLLSMKNGDGPCLDFYTKWVIRRCKQRNLPCQAHEAVAAKLEEMAVGLSLDDSVRDQSQLSRTPRRARASEVPVKRQREPDYRDKLEVKRQKKLEKQRAGLGNRPMPEYFVAPKISPLGHMKLGRQSDEK